MGDFLTGEGSHYAKWREARINKLISILGKEWFKNKEILELACGFGDIGQKLETFGATVTYTDGKAEHIEKTKQRTKKQDMCFLIDQDTNWNLNKKFDLVLHWGVLYHLNNWEQDLNIAIAHSKKYICLESEVSDSDDPEFEAKVKEHWYDGAKNSVGSRPSPAKIEKVIKQNKSVISLKRYDHKDLNACYHFYDWKIGNTKKFPPGQRRFWFIEV
jgi:SAM-dependent methyltransferase